MSRLTTLLLFLHLGAPATVVADSGAELERIREEHEELRATLVRELEEVATFCEDRGLPEAAATVRALVRDEPDDGRIVAEPLPTTMQPEPADTLPEDERTWRTRALKARRDYAGRVYLLARRTLRAGFPSRAYALVRETAEFDPDHESARKLLGWVPYRGEWVTPFARSMMIKRHVRHPRFGWLPRAHVTKYESGMRYYDGDWLPAEREADIRRDFRHAWEVRTAHYLVRTNHSLEEGVRIARALELYHGFFHELFASFFVTPEQQKSLFSGGTSVRQRAELPPHVVHFFRDKDDYVAALKGRFPQIEITNGLYQSGDRVAYFFHDPTGKNLPTIFHEATHQLFYESDPAPRDVGVKAHFWIIEGIACYMESFTRRDGKLTCGDPRYIRFDNARYRLLESGDYFPFAEFSSLGMREFQDGDIETLGKRYSQASGLAHFLMHAEGGRYRDVLIAHLTDLYSPARLRRVRSLPELLRAPSTDIDRAYRRFLENQARDVAKGK